MRRWIAALLMTGSVTATSQPARCAWCPTYTCYAECSLDCACMVGPGNPGGGRCVSFWAVPKLRAAGWQLLHNP